MAVFRIQKTSNYTVMSNHHFKNRNLSLKAKGLLSLMLSLPDDWNYTLEGLVTLNADGRDSIRTALQELEKEGYLILGRERDENGRLGDAIYDVWEQPRTDLPISENPTLEKPISEKPTQLNTKELNTNKSNTNNNYRFNKPSVEEIQEYIEAKEFDLDAESFFDYYEANGWVVGKTKMKDWKATIRNWNRRNNSTSSKSSNKNDEMSEAERAFFGV